MYIPGSKIQHVSAVVYRTTIKRHHDRQYQFTYIHFPVFQIISYHVPTPQLRRRLYYAHNLHVTIIYTVPPGDSSNPRPANGEEKPEDAVYSGTPTKIFLARKAG